MIEKKIRYSLILLLLLLSSCGIHLRDHAVIPDSLSTLRLDGNNKYGLLYKRLERGLKNHHVIIVDRSDDSKPLLKLLNERFEKKELSFYNSGYAAEYEIVYRLTYQISYQNKRYPPKTITVIRSYVDNPNNVLAMTREREYLEQEMQKNAISKLIYSLQNYKEI